MQKGLRTASAQKRNFALLTCSFLLSCIFAACSQGVSPTGAAITTGTTTPSTRALPTPTASPLDSTVLTDNNVNVTVVDGRAYAGTGDQNVYAFDVANGALLWKTKIAGSVDEQPLVVNGIVYITSFVGQNGPSYLSALRASDGKQIWHYQSDKYIFQPVAQAGILYLAEQEESITALRANDGSRVWRVALGADQTPSLNGDVLYTSASSNTQTDGVYALNIRDGSVVWHKPGSAGNTPTLQNGVLYLCCQDGTFSALRASNGQLLWSKAIDATFALSPQLSNGVIYLLTTKVSLETPTTNASNRFPLFLTLSQLVESDTQTSTTAPLKQGRSSLYAIRANDGNVLWQKTINQGKEGFSSWLQVINNVVYTGVSSTEQNTSSTGTITALRSSDGKQFWENKLNGTPIEAVVNNGVLYSIGDADTSVLYALHLQDGGLLWSYPIKGQVFNPPILAAAALYIGANNGILYTLNAENGSLLWHYQTHSGA